MEQLEVGREALPSPVVSAIVLSLEEAIASATNGLASARRQLSAAMVLDPHDRVKAKEMAQNMVAYWKNVISGLKWTIGFVGKRMRWPSQVRSMSTDELLQHNLDPDVRELIR